MSILDYSISNLYAEYKKTVYSSMRIVREVLWKILKTRVSWVSQWGFL